MYLEVKYYQVQFPWSNTHPYADLWHETFGNSCFRSHLWLARTHSLPLIHLAQLLLHWLKWFNTLLACLISSCLFFPPFPSAHRELKVCWSRPLALRSCPPRVLRGNLSQLIPAQITAPRWTLTLHQSSPQAVGPAIPPDPPVIAPLHVTPRLGQRKVKERICIFPTLPSTTLLPLPLRMQAPAPRAGTKKVPRPPLCTDWLEWRLSQVKTHIVWSLHAVTQSDSSGMNYYFFLYCLLVLWKCCHWVTEYDNRKDGQMNGCLSYCVLNL